MGSVHLIYLSSLMSSGLTLLSSFFFYLHSDFPSFFFLLLNLVYTRLSLGFYIVLFLTVFSVIDTGVLPLFPIHYFSPTLPALFLHTMNLFLYLLIPGWNPSYCLELLYSWSLVDQVHVSYLLIMSNILFNLWILTWENPIANVYFFEDSLLSLFAFTLWTYVFDIMTTRERPIV